MPWMKERELNEEKTAASRIEEAARAMNMSTEELMAFYEERDAAYAAKLRELAALDK